MKVGVAVTLTGLKRSDLNGRRGYLCGRQHAVPLTSAGRWPVQLMSTPTCRADDPVLVREENLVADAAADALIESLLTDPDCLLCILGQLETAAQLGTAAAVARLWRAQCQDAESPLWAQLFARDYSPLPRAGGQSDPVAGTSKERDALTPKERARLHRPRDAEGGVWPTGTEGAPTARAAYRLRAELPPATCTAAFDFAQNVRRNKDGTFVSQAHLG